MVKITTINSISFFLLNFDGAEYVKILLETQKGLK